MPFAVGQSYREISQVVTIDSIEKLGDNIIFQVTITNSDGEDREAIRFNMDENHMADKLIKKEEAVETETNTIAFEDFLKVDLRVATVLEAIPHPDPKSTKLLVLKVQLAGGETRQICAGIREKYDPATLVGKQIVVVANLAVRQLRGVPSQGMLLAVSDGVNFGLLMPDKAVEPGTKVS
jgi:tRNA-binding protein